MKAKIFFTLLLTPLWLTFACASGAGKSKPAGNGMAAEAESAFVPVFVYRDSGSSANRFFPSGWMGDVRDISFTDDYSGDSYSGMTSIRIEYRPQGHQRWAGIYWQFPVNNWGDMHGGRNLAGARELVFWARGETGAERISEAKIGGLSGAFPDSDVAFLRDIRLSKEWRQYRIPLRGRDLSRIAGGFAIVLTRKDNPRGAIIYLDEIRYE